MAVLKSILVKRYRIVQLLGGGGMKQVYLSEDLRLNNRQCAVAEMIDSFTNATDRVQAVAAFKREADLLQNWTTDIFLNLRRIQREQFSLPRNGIRKRRNH